MHDALCIVFDFNFLYTGNIAKCCIAIIAILIEYKNYNLVNIYFNTIQKITVYIDWEENNLWKKLLALINILLFLLYSLIFSLNILLYFAIAKLDWHEVNEIISYEKQVESWKALNNSCKNRSMNDITISQVFSQ